MQYIIYSFKNRVEYQKRSKTGSLGGFDIDNIDFNYNEELLPALFLTFLTRK